MKTGKVCELSTGYIQNKLETRSVRAKRASRARARHVERVWPKQLRVCLFYSSARVYTARRRKHE
jgi:hypothetical protein